MTYDPYTGYEPPRRPLTQKEITAREFLLNAFGFVLMVGTVAAVASAAAKILR